MRWLQFILSHSIFIAICAVALCYQSYSLLNIQPDYFIYSLVFFSTLCSYNFYWLVSKYSFAKPGKGKDFFNNNKSYIILFLTSGLGMSVSMYLVPGVFPYLLVGLFLTLLYSLPLWPFQFSIKFRKAGFLKTTLLAFTWAYVTTFLPLALVKDLQVMPLVLLLLGRFFFMLLLCAIFDMRDMKVDKMHALHSLATDISQRLFKVLMMVIFLLYLLMGTILRYELHDPPQFVALLITGLAVWFVYRFSLKPRDYIFYYFIVDGMMLFSAFTTCVADLF